MFLFYIGQLNNESIKKNCIILFLWLSVIIKTVSDDLFVFN